jgi:hypothetical protein
LCADSRFCFRLNGNQCVSFTLAATIDRGVRSRETAHYQQETGYCQKGNRQHSDERLQLLLGHGRTQEMVSANMGSEGVGLLLSSFDHLNTGLLTA